MHSTIPSLFPSSFKWINFVITLRTDRAFSIDETRGKTKHEAPIAVETRIHLCSQTPQNIRDRERNLSLKCSPLEKEKRLQARKSIVQRPPTALHSSNLERNSSIQTH